MKQIIFIGMLVLSIGLQAQDTWTDVVMGKPYMSYFDAKKEVAKEWGIHYQTHFMGCDRTKESQKQAEEIRKTNKAYLNSLSYQFGENWEQYFELEVKKRLFKKQQPVTWLEKPQKGYSKQYYTIKKEIAANWGILYINEASQSPDGKLQNGTSLSKIKSHYGDQWEQFLEQEVQLELFKQSPKKKKMVWKECIMGMLPFDYFNAREVVAKSWGINYRAYYTGCIVTKKVMEDRRKFESENSKLYHYLSSTIGKNWRDYFDLEMGFARAKNKQEKQDRS